jgi:hypothetical protein
MKRLSIAAAVLLLGCAGAPRSDGPGQPPPEGEEPEPGAPAADAAVKPKPADASVTAPANDAGTTAAPDAAVAADTGVAPADSGGAGGAGGAGGGSSGLEQMLLSRAIGLGYYHSCLITPTHDVKCLGDKANDGDPRIHPPAGLKAEQIFGAHNGFCVLPVGATAALAGEPETLPISLMAKKLTCWGHKNTFFPPANLEMDPIQYGIGYDHGCALNADHSVVCWGQGGTNFKAPDGLRAKALTVASFFNCAIKEDDSVVCWGIDPPMPPAGLKAKIVAATFHGNNKLPEAPDNPNHACAIKLDDTVTCWGTENGGNLTVPPDLGPARDIAVATVDTCALRMNGEPVCWGTVKYDNMDPVRYHPMPAGLRLKAIRAKLATYCGIKMEDDSVVCWGDEQHDHITFPAGGVKLYVPSAN